MPSPSNTIARLRSLIHEKNFGLGFTHGLCAPTVVAFSDSSMYDSTYPIIYVGIHQAFPPSAWSCPCVSHNYCPQYAAKFIRTRIDRIHWLQCLSHQRLWCDCGADGADCYAAMLVSVFTYDIATADEETHASFNEPAATMTDDAVPGDYDFLSVPKPLTWPVAWVTFVNTVRTDSFKERLFLECLAGTTTATMTRAMVLDGWSTAPPINLTASELNLLNPTFFMIMAGLIAEQRFILIHVAPPHAEFAETTVQLATAQKLAGFSCRLNYNGTV